VILLVYTTSKPSERSPKRGYAAARLLGLRVRILPGAWVPVSCECFVLSGRGLCIGPILQTCIQQAFCSNPRLLQAIRTAVFAASSFSSGNRGAISYNVSETFSPCPYLLTIH